jgi:predicted nucleic acid-binding protein
VSAVQVVYLDTSLVAAAVAEIRQHAAVQAFLDGLRQGNSQVFVSDLVRVELAQAIKAIANNPNAIPQRTRRKWKLHRWGDLQQVREDWYEYCFTNYDTLLAQFVTAEEVALSRSVIESAIELMAAFQIASYDAIHAATALAAGASTLATLDADFLTLATIPGLTVHVIR